MSDMTLFMRILGNATGLKSELRGSSSAVKSFTTSTKREFAGMRDSLRSLEGHLAGIGISIGVMQQMMTSAKLDKSLIQIGQTAGATDKEVQGLRNDLFLMGRQSGQGVINLKEGFDSLVQSGLSMKEAKETLKGINVGMAVTSARAETLASGLSVAAEAFRFDLAKPGQALALLDKMTVSGREGRAELENLADIFGVVGPAAGTAGLSFDQTLGFVEALSLVQRNPEQLRTLSESTLRLFNNLNYLRQASKATGIKFFDKEGSRRDAWLVLNEFKTQYDKLKTEKEKSSFIQKAFGKADLDLIKGMRILLTGDSLNKMKEVSALSEKAGGTLKRDLPGAVNNASDQVGRLKVALSRAADEFARPIKDATTHLIKKGLDEKKDGGLELSGKEIIAGGGAALVTAVLLKRFGGAAAKKLIGNLGGTAAGVAEGKALEYATGVTPVFVVNMPGSLGGSSGNVVADVAEGAIAAKAGKEVLKRGAKWLPRVAGDVVLGTFLAVAQRVPLLTAMYLGSGTFMHAITGGRVDALNWLPQFFEDIEAFNYEQAHRHDNDKKVTNIAINIDEQGRPVVKYDDLNTVLNIDTKRGNFLGH